METKEQFLEKFNQSLDGWKFTGDNPFTEPNLNNLRLFECLASFAYSITDDDDVYHLQELFETLPSNKLNKSQVDLVNIRDAVFGSIPAMCGDNPQWQEHIDNLQLFIKTLAQNPSFAHKASKELKKLLK